MQHNASQLTLIAPVKSHGNQSCQLSFTVYVSISYGVLTTSTITFNIGAKPRDRKFRESLILGIETIFLVTAMQ